MPDEERRRRLSVYMKKHYRENCEKRKAYVKARYQVHKDEINRRLTEIRCNRPIREVLYRNAKMRAKQKGFEFNLCLEDINVPEKCPVFGLTLKVSRGKCADNSPSIDRIDSKRGYVRDNIDVMSFKANSLKGSATLEELKLLIKYMEKAA